MAYKPCRYLETHGRRVLRDSVFACLAPLPEMPALPASVTKHYGYSLKFPRSYVGKDDCAACPLYTPHPPEPDHVASH